MTFSYQVYGLHIAANDRIPGLVPILVTCLTDLHIFLGIEPPFEASWVRKMESEVGGEPNAVAGSLHLNVSGLRYGKYVRLQYVDGTEFTVDRNGTHLWATWPSELTLEDTATYLLGPVLGFVLRLRGIVSLHASAVAIGDKAIAILGPAGAGKSTTAAAFAQLGYGVLSDDVVSLIDQQDTIVVQPAYPCIRLWPESVSILYGAADSLPLLTPNWDKRYLDLTNDGYRFQSESLSLNAVYILGDRSDDTAAPFVQTMTPQSGIMALIANSYVTYLKDKDMRAQEFDFLSRVAARVPVRQVIPHANPAHLQKLCEVILHDFQSSRSTNGELTGVRSIRF